MEQQQLLQRWSPDLRLLRWNEAFLAWISGRPSKEYNDGLQCEFYENILLCDTYSAKRP